MGAGTLILTDPEDGNMFTPIICHEIRDCINLIRRETHSAEDSYLRLLDRLTAVDLLQVDDVGAERTTDWALEVFYTVVNERYENQRSMIITTNITDREELREQITDRTVSRLTEMCDEIPVHGPDHRKDFRAA